MGNASSRFLREKSERGLSSYCHPFLIFLPLCGMRETAGGASLLFTISRAYAKKSGALFSNLRVKFCYVPDKFCGVYVQAVCQQENSG